MGLDCYLLDEYSVFFTNYARNKVFLGGVAITLETLDITVFVFMPYLFSKCEPVEILASDY